MPIEAECPLCGHKGSVPEKFDNKQVKCPECCNLFIVTGKTVAAGVKGGSSGSQSGSMKISIPGGSAQGTAKPGSSASGQNKPVPAKGSAQGNQKIKPVAPTHQGTVKKPNHGSASGEQKVAAAKGGTGGSASGQHKAVAGKGGTAGSAFGQQKIAPKPGSGQGTQKKPAVPAKKNGTGGSPFGSFTYDDAKGQQVMRRRRRGKSFGNFLALIALLGFLAVVGTGIVLVVRHFSNGGKPDNLLAGILAQLTPAKPTVEEAEPDPKHDPEPKAVETKPKPEPAALVFDASKGPATIADDKQSVQVKVVGVTFDFPPVKDVEKKEKKFMVMLEVENKGKDKVSFQGWGTLEAINELHEPVLTDAGGAPFKRVTFPGGADGQVLAEDVQSTKTIRDLIVFEPPPSGTPFVRLELSAENFGDKEQRKFTLLIPQSVLAKAGMPKPQPKVEPKPEKPPEPPFKESMLVPIQKAALNNPNQPARLDAVRTLSEFGPGAVSVTADMVKVLKTDKSESVRAAAAECLGQFGPKAAKDAIPALVEALKKDEFWGVRAESATALARMGPEAKPVLPQIEAVLKNERDVGAKKALEEAVKALNAKPEDKMEKEKMEKEKMEKDKDKEKAKD